MDQYAVLGNPIGHSRSPLIHAAFAEQTNQAMEYGALEGGLETFEDQLQAWRKSYQGFNVTVPFKHRAFEACDQLTERAQLAGAVNTLWQDRDGQLWGDNTDGVGLVRDICDNLGWAIKGKRVLILGAGGATAGILEPLLREQPSELIIANRTASKAYDLASKFESVRGESVLVGIGLEALSEPVDVILNSTSASLSGEALVLPEHLFGTKPVAYDLMYSAELTPFLHQYGTKCAQTADGWGMLVEQAAEAFNRWRGVRPETQSVIQSLRP